MRVLVTGAGGFIGSHIAEQAVAAGHAVRAAVLPGEDTSLLHEWGVELVVGDLVDPEVAAHAGAGCEVIFNAVGNVNIYNSRDVLYRGNVWATESLLKAAARVRRIFSHQRQIRRDKGPFFIRYITGVGFSAHPQSLPASKVHNTL